MNAPFEAVRGSVARLIERHRRAKHTESETGDTLVEMLISLVVIGITVTALLGAFITTISASAEQRTLSSAGAFMRTFVDTATYDISLSNTPAFVACASSVPAAYNQIAASASTAAFTATITAVSAPPSGCSAKTPAPQQISAKVTSHGVASDATTFVVYPPAGTIAAIATSVTSLSPSFGPASGGTPVTISGNGFTGTTAANAVKFGTVAATSYSVVNNTTISAVAPAGTGTVDVTVTTPAGTSPTNPFDQFTYAPTVSGIAPTSGGPAGGTTVTITGSGFTGASAVKFGTAAATSYSIVSSSSISAVSPAGSAGMVDITVTTIAGTSATSAADQFTYATTVSGISPSSGPKTGGTVVSLLGSGFTGATAVKFGSTAATTFTLNSDSSITATAPAGTAGTVDVTVTTPGGTSATNINDRFTYNAGTPVGLGLVIVTGSKTPVAACATGQGSKCSSPNSNTCMMTSSAATTCDISGIWQGTNNSSVTFYLETVDGSGNPVTYSTTSSLSLSVSSATPASIAIPANSSSTSPNAVTATLTSNNSTNTVTVTGAGWTFTVVVSS